MCRLTRASPRRRAAVSAPGAARWTGPSSGSSAPSSPTAPGCRSPRCPRRPTPATICCCRPPWTSWPGCSSRSAPNPPRRPCTWTPDTTTGPAGPNWPTEVWARRSPSAENRRRSRSANAGSSSAPTPGSTTTAGCAAAPSGDGAASRPISPWPPPSSPCALCFGPPGTATAGMAGQDHRAFADLLADALTGPPRLVGLPAGAVAGPLVLALLPLGLPLAGTDHLPLLEGRVLVPVAGEERHHHEGEPHDREEGGDDRVEEREGEDRADEPDEGRDGDRARAAGRRRAC